MNSYFTPADGVPPLFATGTGAGPRGGPRALVIGSGFGGLAAAIRLALRGWRVEVLEKLDAAGGRAYVWRQDGYTFDAGPTIITAPFMFDELWALAGKTFSDDVELRAMDPYYRIRFDDGTWFDYTGDAERMRAEVARFSPEDLESYERFLEEAAVCYQKGFIELGGIAYNTVGDLLRAVPKMLQMRGWRSIHQMVCSYFKNPKLRIVFSFHPLLIGGNPLSVTCIYSLINTLERRYGVHSAMGGTGAIITAMVKLLESLGGRIRYNAEVARIDVEPAPAGSDKLGRTNGVTLAGGEKVKADIVVSNADTMWTYRHLIEPQYRRRWSNQRIENSRHSMSLFVWYFGTSKRYDDVPHHMMVLGPRYDELLKDIFKRHKLAKDFSLYLHRPTATDPSLAPAGCDAFYVLSPVPHLASGTDWAAHAEPYRQAVAEALERTVLPGLRQHVTTSRVTTPQDFQDRLLSYQGAAFGQEPLLLQSAWFRAHNRSEDIENLFMVGAGTHPGAGIPGVLMSAKTLEQVLPNVKAFA
ncbi:phytoene desaturase [Hydrogenophaga sp.]|uniref:phytoene desaturase n=1 Tax=Hydrogenophaga sp. TaxID=1904254 RepID=UPI00261676F8|nr:phytoene desaturase [Hydrogenophaga sp.]MDM7949879.1 phytoene desaturase [Hydrogenophaga sp.]